MTPQNKLYEAAKAVINRNLPVDKIYNNLDKLKEAISAYEQEQPCTNFEQSNNSTSATICKHCGKEKYAHYCGESISQPEAIAGEKTAKEILDDLYDREYRSNYKTDYPLSCILKSMQIFASQQTSEKDKEIAELKERISELEKLI